jgi:pimeloyl-ACP methyl ester carboxylesterase
MADDTAVLLRALGIHTADLVGYSNGGAVGLQMATQYPGMVRRLVFAGGASSCSPDGYYPELLAQAGAAPDDLIGSVWHRPTCRWRHIPTRGRPWLPSCLSWTERRIHPSIPPA